MPATIGRHFLLRVGCFRVLSCSLFVVDECISIKNMGGGRHLATQQCSQGNCCALYPFFLNSDPIRSFLVKFSNLFS